MAAFIFNDISTLTIKKYLGKFIEVAASLLCLNALFLHFQYGYMKVLKSLTWAIRLALIFHIPHLQPNYYLQLIDLNIILSFIGEAILQN